MKPSSVAKSSTLLLFLSLLYFFPAFSQTTFVTYTNTWKYSNAATALANDVQGDTWIETVVDGTGWSSRAVLLQVNELGVTHLDILRQTPYFRTAAPLSVIAGINTINIESKNGVYILEWKQADGSVITQKIVVQ